MNFLNEMIKDRAEQENWLLKSINPAVHNFLFSKDEESDNIIKSINILLESFIDDNIDESILCKAMSGVYSDTSENKKLGRVGQKYGSTKEEDEPKKKQNKVTGVDFNYLSRFNLSEEYVNKLIPHMVKNMESTKKFIQNLDKLANKLSEQKGMQSFNEAKNLRNLKIYILNKMFE